MSINEGMQCSKCGSYNVSLDFETNQATCNDCKETNQSKRFDLEEYRLNQIANEEGNIAKLKTYGTEVNITTKIKDPKQLNKDLGVDPDENDFSRIGL